MTVLDMLKETPSFLSSATNRPASPSSVAGLSNSSPTVAYATRQTMQASDAVFANPLSNIPQSIIPKDLILPGFDDSKPAPVAIHTRVGQDASVIPVLSEGKEQEQTFFQPRVAKHSYSSLPDCSDCRRWFIIVQAHDNMVQLYCLPLGWKGDTEDHLEEEDAASTDDVPFYLTSKLVLHASGFIREVSFYSNDGKSALSSGNDCGTGMEGRQKLGVLFQEESSTLELWLTSYDSLLWQAVPFESILLDSSEVGEHCTRRVHAMPDNGEDDDELLEDDSVLWAQTRVIAGFDALTDSITKLMLSGSCGIGGVVLTSQGVTSLELLDLEEDEAEEEEEEEFDKEEE